MLNRLKDVFASFQRHEVKYVVIGGIASVLHGVPRATFDLDILILAERDNAQRLLAALLEAGLGTAALTTPEEILANEITVFSDRVRLDVQTPRLAFRRCVAAPRNHDVPRSIFLRGFQGRPDRLKKRRRATG